MQLPKVFVDNMKNLLKESYPKYEGSLSCELKKGFRVNKNYINSDRFDKIFTYKNNKLKGFDNLRLLLTNEKIGNTIYHHAGMIYIQEPSSMLAVESLEPKDGEKILDLCSAPGGKAGQILEKNKSGIVVCNEIVRNRANILMSNIERQGFKNAIITSKTPEELSETFSNFFDKILVDAPCSGEGMFRKDPQTISEWNEGLPEFNHQRQLAILKEADKMLKQNGVLVYSTCTFNLCENEKTVVEFAKTYGYNILDLPETVKNVSAKGINIDGCETDKCARCFPQDDFGEGQFVAKLIKKSENKAEPCFKQNKKFVISKQEEKLIKDFLNEELDISNYKIYKLGNYYYINNTEAEFIGDGVVCFGVNVGSIEKNRVVPHHQLFKAYGEKFKNKINLTINDNRIEKYLSGNEIDVDAVNGYACLLVENVPIGGGKVVNGKLKNYYPKGLRNQ